MKHLRYFENNEISTEYYFNENNEIDWEEDWEEEEENIPCTIYTNPNNIYLPIFKYENKYYHLTGINEQQLSFNEHITINGYELSCINFTSLMYYMEHIKNDNIIEDIKNDKQLLQNDYSNTSYNRTFKYSDLKKIFSTIEFY